MFIGVVFLVFGGNELRQGSKTKNWPAVPGRILSSKVQSGHSSSKGSIHQSRAEGRTDYIVKVRYTYEVDGHAFEGSRLRFGNRMYDSRSRAQKERERYPPGKKIEVFHDPESPQSSVLVKGSGMSWVAIGLGGLVFLLGLGVCINMATRAKRAD